MYLFVKVLLRECGQTNDEACFVYFTAPFRSSSSSSFSGLEHAPSNHEEGRAMHGRGPPLARLDPVDKAARS